MIERSIGMGLPELTHTQAAILGILIDADRCGREVRQELDNRLGVKKNGPAFYQLMARLEDAGFVKGWYETKLVKGHAIKERRYRVTRGGQRALRATYRFYEEELSSAKELAFA